MTVTTNTESLRATPMTGAQMLSAMSMMGTPGVELRQALGGVRIHWGFYRARQAKERQFADTHWFNRDRDGAAIWRKHVRKELARAIAAKKALGLYRVRSERPADFRRAA